MRDDAQEGTGNGAADEGEGSGHRHAQQLELGAVGGAGVEAHSTNVGFS
jgi:hypothetical protein